MNTTSSQLKAYKRATSIETSRWYMASLMTDLADKKDTNGAFCLVEATLAPGNEPPPHEHSREDELFYVLEGEFDVYVGKEAFKVEKGECVFSSQIEAARICDPLRSDSLTHSVQSCGTGRCISRCEFPSAKP